MIQSILVLVGESTYNSTVRFLMEMIREWKQLGIQVAQLSLYNALQYKKIRQEILEGRRFDMIFSFNGMMLETDNELTRAFLQGETIYCTQLMDHPLHHHFRLQNTYSKIVVFSPDYRHVEYLKNFYPNIWSAGFLAHGGCENFSNPAFEDRDIFMSFVGSYFPAEKYREEFVRLGGNRQRILEHLSNYMKINTSGTIEEGLEELLEHNGISVTKQEFAWNLSQLKLADIYIRGYYREKVIQTLLDGGITVDVYGNGWKEFDCRHSELLRIHPACDFKSSLQVTAQSKFSLNVMPWFKGGAHDRIFTAMGCGAIPVSDSSQYLEEIAGESGMLLYSLDDLKKLPEQLLTISSQEAKAAEMSRQAKEQFELKHTWRHRARGILDYLTFLASEER